MNKIFSKISNMELTKVDKKIAEYFTDNLTTIGFYTSSMLANEIGVSDSSVVRFIHKLGYKGYSEFRTDMNLGIAEKFEQARQESLNPKEKISQTKEALKKDDLASDISENILNNLQQTLSKLDMNVVKQVARMLIVSKRKCICGFRGTASCAIYLANKLILMLPNVSALIHPDSTVIEQTVDLKKGDCLFVYSFPRSLEITKVIMELAKKHECNIILVTDNYASPLAKLADIVITANVKGNGIVNSYLAPMCISDIVLLAVSKKLGTKCKERMKNIDSLLNREKL